MSAQSYAGTAGEHFISNSASLFLVGENHLHDSEREDFKQDLLLFKQTGGHILALEMIESNYQHLLLENDSQALFNYLQSRWGYNSDSYLNLIMTAQKLGLEVIAIDLPKALRPKELILPAPPGSSKVDEAREAHMAQIICAHKDKKTAVLIGSFHVRKQFLPKTLSQTCGIDSFSFTLF